jgi:hypothetical protein
MPAQKPTVPKIIIAFGQFNFIAAGETELIGASSFEVVCCASATFAPDTRVM